MSIKLYEITEDYQKSLHNMNEMLEGDEISEADKKELIENSLICLSDKFDAKALNVAAYIANGELSVSALKTVESRMIQRRRAMERKVEVLKQYLLDQMQYMDKATISNENISINVRQNPCKVIVEDQNKIPMKYQKETTVYSVIKSEIAAQIKKGESISGAYLQSSSRLSIK